jgi:type IV secretory pathway VirB3-like protein
VQIPFAVLIAVLVASLAPWALLILPGMWLVWQVVKDPEPARASVLHQDGHA